MLTMIDLRISNLHSVRRAFERIGAPVKITTDPAVIAQAGAVILPGVGAFGDGMASLQAAGLIAALQRHVRAGRPLLGICLGMQLLADQSEEHDWQPGLGLLPGRVVRLRPAEADARVPNMGWCDVTPARPGGLFPPPAASAAFYFAHSYHLECAQPEAVAAALHYGGSAFTAAIEYPPLYGVQFHPEKSQDAGLNVLAAFLAAAGRPAAEAAP